MSVSRTLEACDAQTVAAVEQAIITFSRPFSDEQVHDLVMIIPLNLTVATRAVKISA